MKTSNDKYKFRGIPDCASMWAHRLNLFLENHSSPLCRVTLGVSKREISRYETAIVVLRYACIPVSVNSRVCSTTKTFPPRRGHRGWRWNEHKNGTTFRSRWIAKGDEWHERLSISLNVFRVLVDESVKVKFSKRERGEGWYYWNLEKLVFLSNLVVCLWNLDKIFNLIANNLFYIIWYKLYTI